jgi:uncharacterized cupin superfamily protein
MILTGSKRQFWNDTDRENGAVVEGYWQRLRGRFGMIYTGIKRQLWNDTNSE